jgi:hypothetical protein
MTMDNDAMLAYALRLEKEVGRHLTATEIQLLGKDFAAIGKPSKATLRRIREVNFDRAKSRSDYIAERLAEGAGSGCFPRSRLAHVGGLSCKGGLYATASLGSGRISLPKTALIDPNSCVTAGR